MKDQSIWILFEELVLGLDKDCCSLSQERGKTMQYQEKKIALKVLGSGLDSGLPWLNV